MFFFAGLLATGESPKPPSRWGHLQMILVWIAKGRENSTYDTNLCGNMAPKASKVYSQTKVSARIYPINSPSIGYLTFVMREVQKICQFWPCVASLAAWCSFRGAIILQFLWKGPDGNDFWWIFERGPNPPFLLFILVLWLYFCVLDSFSLSDFVCISNEGWAQWLLMVHP